MPQLWNNIYVVTKDELVPKFWKNYNSLKLQLHRYKDKSYGIKRVQVGGNGRQMLISFDSLPKEMQEAIGDPRKLQHILEQFYKTDANAVDYYTNFQYPDGSYLPPNTVEQYITNASMVKALIALKKARETERLTKGGSTRGITQTLISDAVSFNPILKKKHNIEHNIPTSRRFTQVLKSFANQGYISLIKDPEGKRKKNALILTDETVSLLNAMFTSQKHKPNPTKIADQYTAFLAGYVDVVNQDTGEIYNPKDFKALSTASIRNYLTTWDSSIGTHAIRNGHRQQLQQKFIPYHSLKQAHYAGSLLSIDDRQPPFEYEKGKRMWFYNAIDLGSEAFTCWVWGKSKEGIIVDFYRQLVRNYHEWGFNLPDGLECESSLNSSFKETFLKEGSMFQNVRIEANNARGKRIEAYFKPLRYQLEKEREGWLARPFALSESNQISNVAKKIIPYKKLTSECLVDIMTWNNTEHSKIKGKTRWEVFLESQNPNLKPTNYKSILPHLGYHTQTSCNAGIIKLQRGEWLLGDNGEIFTGANLIRLMQAVETKDLDVYWLDDNQGNVFKALAFINGRYICEILPKPTYARAKIERTPADEIARDLMTRYVNTISGYMKDQKNAIEKVSVTDNRSKTLNNKFQIAGLGNYQKKTTPVEELPQHESEENYSPAQTGTGSSWESAFRI
ncbi:hypothetical protein PL373_08115 [Tenacibaculum maritimum]|nr:hypothetical protein [Tenacibaculum maritimum]MDB0601110.1 hypothetical protein [Tenacibaculum maritimum]MDB0612192.1 hypothetical protein [Tenacibaculum maritimum]